MRLHRLEMVAFGPFAETTVVDFDALGADGLFLLHGQTGAGKTTVLDAIAFALYGRVPGARGESKRLHSDHASPQTPPRVELEATLGGRRVLLTRSPEFERPKLRGTGTRIEQPKAALAWLDGQGENLSRIPDIGEVVTRLLGMSADQFFQVVLLPQGDFARFLRAENEEREKLLEKLFETQRFGAAEQWLAERRRASEAQLAQHSRNVENLIVQVAVTAGIAATETVGPLEAVEWSQDLLIAARAELSTATAELELRRKESTHADALAEEERRSAELRRRMAAAQQQLDEYAATADRRAADEAELDRARRAAPIAAALDEARTAVRAARHRDNETERAALRLRRLVSEPASRDIPGVELVQATVGADENATSTAERSSVETPLNSAVAAAGNAVGTKESDSSGVKPVGDDAQDAVADSAVGERDSRDADLDASIRRWSAHLGTLDEVRADATAAQQLSAELAELRAENAELGEVSVRLTRRRAELPQFVAAAETRSREASEASAALPGLTADCERLQAAASAAVELAKRRTALDHARVELETARTAHLDAKERVLQLRERRLAGMAAELAGRLAEGQPCTVCGSVDHPDPARPAPSAVSKDAEDAAAAEEQAAEAVRDRALATITGIERDIEALIARGGDTDRVELAAALRTATDRYTDAADLADQVESAAAELTRLRAEESRLHDELRATETTRGTITTRIAAAETRLHELDGRLRAAAGADQAIDRRRNRLESLIAAATALRDARAAAASAWAQAITTAQRVEKLALEAGFVPDAVIAASEAGTRLGQQLDDDPSHQRTSDRHRTEQAGSAPTASPEQAARTLEAHGERRCGTDPAARLLWGDESGSASAVSQEGNAAGAPTPATRPARRIHADSPWQEVIALLAEYAKVIAEASRPAQRLEQLEEALLAADRSRAHAEAVLAEPEIQAAAATEPRDLAALHEAVRVARADLDAAVAAHAEASARVSGLEELSGQLWAAVDMVAPAQRQHEELAALAEVVAGRGANNRRMSLRSYVLAARLEEVALAGSVRLRRMSGGRYEFVHTDKAGPRGRRGGLGLDIRDDYTGAIRPAKTLSGGETFMASLALALGLADTVAAESGGVVLDTLFIDEGFGGLDADTLDAVMGVLDELRAGGRVVGIVSHVDEMRQRIPSRLHVIRGRTGSHLRATVA
ncbi:double-stranded DNA exonuclease [Nocardia donostiensis]|uniref:AAA family ATPase n=1 Tax=Nocardia donostiensis TaxID=1538463 RepID=UPI0009DAC96D|nr:AAA family ATPase [Nocardia donostiensis]OQS17146.1 double-stranded DNA exonuclease [Nocardia donostiensis]